LITQIVLVRHGQTDWNHARRIQGGGSDIPLNIRGAAQAEGLARRLSAEGAAAIYSSDLQRAMSTATVIARNVGLEVTPEPDLREIEGGTLEGQTLGDLGRRLDELLVRGDEQAARTGVSPFGSETLAHLQQRAWPAVQRIAGRHPGGTVLLVTHYFVILSVVCAVLELPLWQVGRFRMSVGSVSRVNFEDAFPRLVLFNDTSHLE